MPISPLLCLKFVNCQHCWQKATISRLFCSTVAWGRLARVLLALPLLGEMPPCTWCSGEHGESTHGTWEPGVKGVKGACKGEKGLVEGKADRMGGNSKCQYVHPHRWTHESHAPLHSHSIQWSSLVWSTNVATWNGRYGTTQNWMYHGLDDPGFADEFEMQN